MAITEAIQELTDPHSAKIQVMWIASNPAGVRQGRAEAYLTDARNKT